MIRTLLLAIGLLVSSAAPARAQEVMPDDFREGLAAFDLGDFDRALIRFMAVASSGERDWISAGHFMAAKSLYRAHRFEEAEMALRAFLAEHPGSRYAQDADHTLSLARAAIAVLAQRARAVGVILSLHGEESAQSQAIFNGIRQAVDEHNGTAAGHERVRLVFRDIGAQPSGAATAVASLADEGVTVILGALFSDQARMAAAEAETRRVVFVAPLATDDRVSESRRFVFQANPTIATRGRVLARFAVNGLLLRRFGVLAAFDSQGFSTAMAEAFRDEVVELGGEVVFFRTLDSGTDWSNIAETLPAAPLRRARGLFVPLAGRQAEREANALIQSLTETGADVRVLGNAEWHQLRLGAAADPFAVTYLNDFRVEPEERFTREFLREHRRRFGVDAGRLAHVGYDVTRFLLQAMQGERSATDIADALRRAPLFDGTGMRIDFRGGQVNEALFYQRYRDGRVELLR